MEILRTYKEAFISAVTLVMALIADNYALFQGHELAALLLYAISYLSVGVPVWQKAWKSIKKGVFFSEFLLMGIATIGALALGEYAEGVAVMLFYTIGEYAQEGAVHRARSSISRLINQQPEKARVERENGVKEIPAADVQVGDIIRVLPGDKVPLDGKLISETVYFNMAALTGESKPVSLEAGDKVLAGSISQQSVRIEVDTAFNDTRLSKILDMVQEAAKRKAPTQRFMTRFARYYTPAVVWLAVALTFLPYLLVENYIFEEWFYRALIFLVVSCPCGLVISIPLGYFGGIGAASQNGILLKGSDFLDQLRKMNVLFVDKTGTLTKGVFDVQDINTFNGISEDELLRYAASLEQHSTHPIAKAIVRASNGQNLSEAEQVTEKAGRGLMGKIDNSEVIVGNEDWMREKGIEVKETLEDHSKTKIFIGINGELSGMITIDDEIKEDAKEAIRELKSLGVEKIIMLSGDKQRVAEEVAGQLGLDEVFGDLLPDEKFERVKLLLNKDNVVGFAGDGLNDAPVITLSDVGIAMGAMGSDATIETADVVIQTDQPSKIAKARKIAGFTHKIVWQNIAFALGIKILVMIMAAFGLASMWEAIFADVGVALIAIGNAVRVQVKHSDGTLMDFITGFRENKPGNKVDNAEACCSNC